MTAEEAAKLLQDPKFLRFAAGRKMEWLSSSADSWFPTSEFSIADFLDSNDRIRIAPEPRKVPLTQDDLPDQPWFRRQASYWAYVATATSAEGIWIEGSHMMDFAKLQSEGWEFAPSHKGPWLPCSKPANE